MLAINILIVEDELFSAAVLEDMLLDYKEQILEIRHAASLKQARELLKVFKPNLIFLDVFLPDGRGFDLLSDSLLCKQAKVICTTAYDHYAVQAFQYAVLHYLLKPIDPEQLDIGLQRFFLLWSAAQEQLLVRTQKEHYVLRFEELAFLQAEGSYTLIQCCSGQEIMASKSMSSYEKQIPKEQFVRIHDKYIINLQQLKTYIKGKAGGGEVLLHTGHRLPVSVRKKQILLDYL